MFRQFAISVLPASPSPLVTFNTLSFGDKVVGQNAVNDNIWLNGGNPPYAVTLEPGSSLPQGVELLPGYQFDPNWNPSAYAIAGRVSTPGTYNFTLRATDSVWATVTQTLALKVATVEALMRNLPLNGASTVVNAPYSYGFVARGGDGNYTWAGTGSMPSGMTVASSGKFAGTPLDTGWQCCYTLSVADSSGASCSGGFGFTVSATTPTTLVFWDGNDLGTSTTAQIYTYWFSVGSNGGSATPPFMLALAPGSALPAGLWIFTDSNGNPQLTGLPSTPGDYFFNLQVTDATRSMGQKHFHLKVSSVFIPNSPWSYGTSLGTGSPYSYQFQVFGATGAVTWSVASGTLPPGLTLDASTGLLSGTPTTAGNTAFTIQAQDGAGNTYQTQVPLNVSAIQITTSQYLPKAISGTPYSVTLAATPASGSYTWSWNYGSDLCGLALDPATGQISGTPQCSGYNPTPTVTVSGGTSQAMKTFLLPMSGGSADVPYLYLDATTLRSGSVGLYYQASFSPSGGTPRYRTPTLVSGSLPPGLSFVDQNVLTGGATPGQFELTGVPTAAGRYSFTIQTTDAAGIQTVRYATVVIAPFVVLTSNLPNAVYGRPYTAQLSTVNCSECAFAMPTSYWYALPPGLSLSGTGLLSGTPSGTGSYYFPVTVSSGSASAVVFLQVRVQSEASRQAIDFGSYNGLDHGSVGKTFIRSYYAYNYSGTPTWTLAAGSLPPGMNFLTGSAAAALGFSPSYALVIGAPSVPGTYSYTVRVDDTSGNFGIEPQTLIVSELGIAPTALKPALAGARYNQKLKVAGGMAPYSFTLFGEGSLPLGMTLSNDGTLSGTPTEDGYFYPILQVNDANGIALIQQLYLQVFPASVGSIPLQSYISMPTGSVGQAYAASLDPAASAGGVPPFTVTLKPGSALPPGLSLIPAATGPPNALAGIPTASGSFNFTVTLSDSAGNSQDTVVYLQVSNLSVSPTNGALPPATLGATYSQSFAASGGVAPYTFSLNSYSDMPPGLALSSSGVLSGTPTYAGDFSVQLNVVDASGSSVYPTYTLSAGSTAMTSILTPNPGSIQINYAPGQQTPAPVSLSGYQSK